MYSGKRYAYKHPDGSQMAALDYNANIDREVKRNDPVNYIFLFSFFSFKTVPVYHFNLYRISYIHKNNILMPYLVLEYIFLSLDNTEHSTKKWKMECEPC